MDQKEEKTIIKSVRVPEELVKLVDQYTTLENGFYGVKNTFSQIVNQAVAFFLHERIKGFMGLDPKTSKVFTVTSEDPGNVFINHDRITQYCYDEIRRIYEKALKYDKQPLDEHLPLDADFWGYYDSLHIDADEKIQELLGLELVIKPVEEESQDD